eukprot:358951-Chlamydomonas_euryale.AAC.8
MLAMRVAPMTRCHSSMRESARSASSARTRSFRSPRSSREMVPAMSSILFGPRKRLATARFWLSKRLRRSFVKRADTGLPSSSSSRA